MEVCIFIGRRHWLVHHLLNIWLIIILSSYIVHYLLALVKLALIIDSGLEKFTTILKFWLFNIFEIFRFLKFLLGLFALKITEIDVNYDFVIRFDFAFFTHVTTAITEFIVCITHRLWL